MKTNTRFKSLLFGLFCVAGTAQAGVPFEPTTIVKGQFAEGTKWYTMTIGSGLRISDNGSADHIKLGGAMTTEDENLWCFVGDDTKGYRIFNKQAGPGKALTAPTTMSGNNDGSSFAILKDTIVAGGFTNLWDFKEATKKSDGGELTVKGVYYVNEHGRDRASYILNNRNSKLAFWSGGFDDGSVICLKSVFSDFVVNMQNGKFTSTNQAGTWASVWKSTATKPQLTLSTGANNMCTKDNGIGLASGQAGSSVYTLSAGQGYEIMGYTFTFKNDQNSSKSLKFVIGEKEYNVTNEWQTVTVKDLNAMSAQFTLSGDNHVVMVKDFKVNVSIANTKPEAQLNLFVNDGSKPHPYRIPAIAKTHNGDLLAINDYRWCGADIGFGRVDIVARISKDNGKTWGNEFTIAAGTGKGNSVDCGFGDAALVADSESDTLLLITACGKMPYQSSTTGNPIRVARFYSYDNGQTWTKYKEITQDIYGLFDKSKLGAVQALFFGSGRICQSRQVKVGSHYRLYAALCARPGGNRVIYSDDLGKTWNVLGSIDVSPAPNGDEPKCEELPDGTVILSSRMDGGRFFNYFTYTDVVKGEGSWGTVTASNAGNKGVIANSNSTNGEIMIIPAVRNEDKAEVYLALQSVPFGPKRSNVGIFYKELSSADDMADPVKFAANWDGSHQSSFMSSAYSTMIMQANDTIAFLYEESTFGRDYTGVYKAYSVEDITKGAYSYKKDVNRSEFVAKMLGEKIAAYDNVETGEAVGMFDAEKAGALSEALAGLVEEYKSNPTVQNYADVMSKVNETVKNAQVQLTAGLVYTLQNRDRNGKYLCLSQQKDNINGKHFIYGGATTNTEDSQKFYFSKNEDGTWSIGNSSASTFVSPTQAQYKHVFQVKSLDEAGHFKAVSSTDGWTALVCTNPVNASVNALHLSGENALVEWYASENASQWKIVPTGEKLETAISIVEQQQKAQVKYYDLQGRQLKGAPAQGFYITSDRKKHLVK